MLGNKYPRNPITSTIQVKFSKHGQAKWSMIISNKHGTYQLSLELPNDLIVSSLVNSLLSKMKILSTIE